MSAMLVDADNNIPNDLVMTPKKCKVDLYSCF